MAYKGLANYITELKKNNELIEIQDYVNPSLEITEITDRFSKQPANNNKALLFTNTGTQFPVFINGFGSETRMALALGASSLEEPKQRIESLFSSLLSPKSSMWEKLKMLPLLQEMSSWMPKHMSGKGQCQEIIVQKPDLASLPILQCWPHDGGKFITLPMVITEHPQTKTRNVGMYRMQIIDSNTTAMHWHKHKTGANHYEAYKQEGKKMPIAVALGGDPAHTFSATAPLPENIDEFMLSGFLRKKKVELVKCITNNLEVPADADIIIEGYINPQEEKFLEGPFGDHTGFYSLPDYYPKFHITCITHKKDAIYPATIVGIPPMEDAWIGKATERIFLAPIKFLLVPEMIDYTMPFEGVAHNLVIAKIHKTYAGQAQKVMNTLWGAGQMMFNKSLIIVDEHCNISSYDSIIASVLKHCNPLLDIVITKGPLDVLDHAAPQTGFGSKIGFDATTKLPEELDSNYASLHNANYSLVPAQYDVPIEQILNTLTLSANIQYVILHDDTIQANDVATISWHVLNNINPTKDCTTVTLHSNHVYVIDGRTKPKEFTNRDWPTPVISDEKTIATIDKKWHELQLGEFIDSPSNVYKSIVLKNSAWLYSHKTSE